MPRLAGVRERFDKTFYDTQSIEPGQCRLFFDVPRHELEACPECGGKLTTVVVHPVGPQYACKTSAGCGGMFDSELFRTNLLVSRRFLAAPHDTTEHTYVVLGVGLRLLEKNTEDELRLLDYLHVRLAIGERVGFEQVGSMCSTLDPRLTDDELRGYRELLASHGAEIDRVLEQRPMPMASREAASWMPKASPGYALVQPLIVGRHMDVRFEVSASAELPSALRCRVLVFGLATHVVT